MSYITYIHYFSKFGSKLLTVANNGQLDVKGRRSTVAFVGLKNIKTWFEIPLKKKIYAFGILTIFVFRLYSDNDAASAKFDWFPWSFNGPLFHGQLGENSKLQSQTRWYPYCNIPKSRFVYRNQGYFECGNTSFS